VGLPPDDHERLYVEQMLQPADRQTGPGNGPFDQGEQRGLPFRCAGKLPARLDAGIVQSFTAPRLEHSRKPDIVREKLVQLLGDVPRIELFARQSSHGFDVWGNQCESPAVALLPGIAEYIGERLLNHEKQFRI
jgi:hypothetical protein